jgi:hypothetical protein
MAKPTRTDADKQLFTPTRLAQNQAILQKALTAIEWHLENNIEKITVGELVAIAEYFGKEQKHESNTNLQA